MSEEDEERGFRVTDKRKRSADDAANAEPEVLGDGSGIHVGPSPDEDGPHIDFGSFAMSLAHSALVSMGIVQHPELGDVPADLESAKQTIEILEMLRDKTAGNLDPEEDKLLGSVLYELRMSYVGVSASKVNPTSD